MQRIYNVIAKQVRPIELALLLKKLLRIRRRTYSIGGFQWKIDPVSDFGFRMLNEGAYEPEMTERILSKLEKGETFVDLGANEGYFSVLGSRKVGPDGRVFSIEPQERLWSVIANNIELNRLTNIVLLPYAISTGRGTTNIILSPSINSGSSTIVRNARRKFWETQTVNTMPLDELLGQQQSDIKLMKIDIEGFEFFALKSAEELLKKRRIKNIVVELHEAQLKSLGQSVEEIDQFLRSYGFIKNDGVYSLL
jgi:FkbM family methyltransferase